MLDLTCPDAAKSLYEEACAAAEQGDLECAKSLLSHAVAHHDHLKLEALQDPRLQEFWATFITAWPANPKRG